MSQGLANTAYPVSGSSKVAITFSPDNTLADEGSFFVASVAASAPTVGGTAIATTTSVVDDAATQSSTHAQASPVILIQNQWPAGPGAMNLYLRYIKMMIVQVPTSASVWSYAMRLDPLSTKLTTAGTVLVPQNVNSNSGVASRAYVSVGAITTVIASGQSRLTGNGLVDGAIPITQDQWNFTFGDSVGAFSAFGVQTSAKQISIPCAPQIIAPTYFWTLEMWGASNAAAPSWVSEIGYVERPQGQ